MCFWGLLSDTVLKMDNLQNICFSLGAKLYFTLVIRKHQKFKND